jgi:hypothetical protein
MVYLKNHWIFAEKVEQRILMGKPLPDEERVPPDFPTDPSGKVYWWSDLARPN